MWHENLWVLFSWDPHDFFVLSFHIFLNKWIWTETKIYGCIRQKLNWKSKVVYRKYKQNFWFNQKEIIEIIKKRKQFMVEISFPTQFIR